MARPSIVSIDGDRFLLNGRALHEGRVFRGMPVDGLLLNSRMVQGIFDDENPQTRPRWDRPGAPWDAERNTREFIAAMPSWSAAGLDAFTLCLQGGSPEGYSREQPWENSAFASDGSPRGAYFERLGRVLARADELSLTVILGVLYFGQEPRLQSEAAVTRAVDAATDWLVAAGRRNVVVEIANECDVRRYRHDIVRPQRAHELIQRVQARSAGRVDSPAGRLLVSTSFGGGSVPTPNVAAAADFLLIHGNGVAHPDGMRDLVRRTRAVDGYRGQPVVCNEDDHYDFDREDNNFLAALSQRAGWGYFDFRRSGEPFIEGYQSMPADWTASSARKRAFFDLAARVAGRDRP